MTWKAWIAALVMAGALATAALPTVVGEEPEYSGHQKFFPWKMGVDGANTRDGFVISKVFTGFPANRLGPNQGWTMDPGDRIVEVNGVPLDGKWTLQKALGYSGGKIDFKYWDDRQGKYITFRGVNLVP
jgi:S1-C subfamily serine protease